MNFSRIQKGVLTFVDAVLVNVSTVIAFLLKYDAGIGEIPPGILDNAAMILSTVTFVKIAVFYFFRLYSSIWKFAGIFEMVSVVFAAFIGNAIVLCVFEVCSIRIPVSALAITVLTDIFLIGGIRFAYRSIRRIFSRYLSKTGESKRILIIGNGESGAIVLKEFQEHPELNCFPVAIIDDNKEKTGKKINGVTIVGQYKDIRGIVLKKRIDEIIIALPNFSKSTIDEIYHKCLRTNCKVRILPSFTQLIDGSFIIPKIRNVNIEDLLGREPIDLHIGEISACLEGKVVLVTGAGGSIGSELCRQIILYKPKQLVILDNYENNVYENKNELRYLYSGINVTAVIANIRELDRIEEVFDHYRPDIVFHAAAHKHVPLMEENPGEAVKNNVFGTLNLVECSEKFGAKKFVLISTDKAVNPTSVMGATKRVAEMIIQSINKTSKTEFSAVRFGNVLGSNGSVVPLFQKQIERGGPVTITHPDVTRFFMTIPEAAHLVIHAGAMAKGGEIFVLDMGNPIKISDLAKKLIILSGFEPDIDIKIEYTGLRSGEKMHEELILAEEGLQVTKNNKIFITKPVFTHYELLKDKIKNLAVINNHNREEVMNYLENIIRLDKEHKT